MQNAQNMHGEKKLCAPWFSHQKNTFFWAAEHYSVAASNQLSVYVINATQLPGRPFPSSSALLSPPLFPRPAHLRFRRAVCVLREPARSLWFLLFTIPIGCLRERDCCLASLLARTSSVIGSREGGGDEGS